MNNNRIITVLHNTKLPIEDIAAYLHVSRKTIQIWDKRECKTSIETLCKISELTNKSTDYLLGLDDREYLDVSGIDKGVQAELSKLINCFRDYEKSLKEVNNKQ